METSVMNKQDRHTKEALGKMDDVNHVPHARPAAEFVSSPGQHGPAEVFARCDALAH